MNGIEAIAFDLDGTLVDSAGGVAHALNAALAVEALPPFALDTVRAWIGDGPDALIARALAALDPARGTPHDIAARLRRGFDAATLQSPMAGSQVYAGIAELLAELAARMPLVVVTNKPTPLARAVLNAAGLLPSFSAVHGADSTALRKPSPLMLQRAAAGLGLGTAALLMVGDAEPDLGAAQAAGCRAAWAGWGYGRAPAHVPRGVWRLEAPHALLARLDATTLEHTDH